MSDQATIVRVLADSKLFGALEAAQLSALAGVGRLESMARGERLFDQGRPCEGMFVVASGQVKVFKLSPEGKEHLLHKVGPGETFAEAALFGGFDYPASAECAEAGQLVFLPKRPMLQLLADHPAIPLKLLSGMSVWLRRMVDLMEDIVLRDSLGRVAKHLLSLRRDEGDVLVQMTLKHGELAAHLGMTRETISRTMAHLEAMGLIALQARGRVRIKDVDRLAELAGR